MRKRILHVVGEMNRGGVETWLMHILRHIDHARYQIDFLVHTIQPCAYDDEIRALGSRIIPCLHPSQPLTYARKLRSILQVGRYDVVHSHVHHYSGWVLRIAAQEGVSVRIAHSHSDTSSLQATANPIRKLYLKLMKYWIWQHTTIGLGVSKYACAALFGDSWQETPRWQVLYYGIDLTPFEIPVDRTSIRKVFNVPPDALVIGHVGRFDEVKNHQFIIRIAEQLIDQYPDFRILLVGDGLLRSLIEKQVKDSGLSEWIIFTGLRNDVPRLMKGVMDVFVLPSLYEGFPMVLIEAQAAGLPCIYSDVITNEAAIIPQLVQAISLQEPIDKWVEAVMAYKNLQGTMLKTETLKHIQESHFTIEHSLQALENIYRL